MASATQVQDAIDLMNELMRDAIEMRRLEALNAEMLEALRVIAKGEGAFSTDPLEHCTNTVESMKAIARAAIAKAEAADRS